MQRTSIRTAWLLAATAVATGLLVGVAGGPAGALPPRLPPLQQPATAEHHPGKVIFEQLVTPDLQAAERFYGGLFGWSFRALPGGSVPYATAWLGDRHVASLYQRDLPPGAKMQSAWLTFFSARDVSATSATATSHGARLLFGPRDIPDLGQEAVLRDPQGAVFALLASGSGDPPDTAAGPGDWIWSSLITTDPDDAAAFYQTLLGCDVYDTTTAADAHHLVLASDGYARASVNPVPASRPDAHPRWLDYLRVADVDATAKQAVALGGRILVAPKLDHGGSRIAVVADPLGAAFGLMEWSDDAAQGDAK